jgi:carbon-monoxide dehydrogenase medium subunit
MWHTYYAPSSLAEALELLAQHGDDCRLIAGGTDLILELERGVRRQQILVDISRIPGLDRIEARRTHAPSSGEHVSGITLGANVTHHQAVASAEIAAHAFPLARACWLVGAPQIRNRGTVAGNLCTASPANDTITPLWAMDATVTLASRERGERTLPLDRFFLGVRKTALQPDEMLVRINIPALTPTERGAFLKLGLRQAQAISVVNVAAVVEFDGEGRKTEGERNTQYAIRARLALGAVAPTIVRAAQAEAYLAGKELTGEVIAHAAELAAVAARPISDIRGSAEYRRDMVRVLTGRALRQVRDGTERAGWPERPVLLWGPGGRSQESGIRSQESGVRLLLNGHPTVLKDARGKTLLRALREDAGLTGTKEGCAEGECGACTVWLDGMAVMSCLTPAERAEGCEVVTVEGLADLPPQPPSLPGKGEVGSSLLAGEGSGERSGAGEGSGERSGAGEGSGERSSAGEGSGERSSAGENLHPLQRAFIEAGAVQCGYCTPGLLMSAANLLQECPQPTAEEVKQALAGNLCRCTGYYSILEAVDRAAQMMQGQR